MNKKFDLELLGPLEFEKFCKDLMEVYLSKKFKNFKPGKDQGIDLRNLDENILCQCKRISNINNLKSSLKKEVEKVKKMYETNEFSEYYLLIVNELSPQEEKELIDIMEPYLKSENLISYNEIVSILEKDENKEILRRNVKLWLTSSAVLELFNEKFVIFQADSIKNDIKSYSKFFVETEAFNNALAKLNEQKYLIITGMPGVGKTITSYMLVAKMLVENPDISIKTTTIDCLDELIKSLSKLEKELIIIDDFLGKNNLILTEIEINNINKIIKYAKSNNKFLILNSRNYILEEGKNFNYDLNKIASSLSIVDINVLSLMERAKILFNMQYYNNVPFEYYENLLRKSFFDKNYRRIIQHKNFNARVIEYCAQNYSKDEISSQNYSEYIIDNLENSNVIWKNQFSNFKNTELTFFYILYTLTKDKVSIDKVNEAFYNSCVIRNYDTSINLIEEIIEKFNGSLLKLEISTDGSQYISFINPSILDYIMDSLEYNSFECIKLANECVYLSQLFKLTKLNGISLAKYNGNILDLKTQSGSSKDYEVINFISEFNYKDIKLKDYINQLIFAKKIINNKILSFYYSDILREFYGTSNIIDDVDYISKLIGVSSLYDIEKFLDELNLVYLSELSDKEREKIVSNLKDKIDSIIQQKIEESSNSISYNLDEIIDRHKGDIKYEDEDECRNYLNLDEIEEQIKLDLEVSVESDFSNELDDLRFEYISFDNLCLNARDCIEAESIEEYIIDYVERKEYSGDKLNKNEHDIEEIFMQEYPKE